MSHNNKSQQSNKYYNNDFKKLMGIDDSRSASQKLLDKVVNLKRNKIVDNDNQGQQQQIKKKVHKNQQDSQNNTKPLTVSSNLQILQNKLIKNIKSQTNQVKLIKALSLLKKCLNEQSFLSDKQINFKNNWQKYAEILIGQIKQRNYCSGQSFNIMQNLAECIQILKDKFGSKISKNQNNKDLQEGQQKQQIQQQSLFDKQKIFIDFCKLFTDDSFIFHKHLNKIKKFLFNRSSIEKNNQNDMKIDKTSSNITKFQIMIKLVTIPIKYDWAYTSLVNLFKQFNNNSFQYQFEQSQRKQYLKKYNQFLNKKVSSSSLGIGNSYHIMGDSKSIQRAKIFQVQLNQSSADKWCSKQ